MTSSIMHPKVAVRLLAILFVTFASSQLFGEVLQVKLPADYADFAMHPDTGTIAALSAETNEISFFRIDDLKAEPAVPVAKATVGATPCSVVYKRFQDVHVFAVACSQDSHMYLFNAGGPGSDPKTDFQLLKKIELAQSGVSYVTGSINLRDPFLYYCYGSGHDSETGVVSLRDMRNHGKAFDDAMDCAISASGEVAYRRGPWSPSGFESLIRGNSLDDETPQFSRLFYDHNSTAQYIPDPFDRFTAAGTNIYSRGLDKQEASLDFVPYCFFAAKPVVVGIVQGDNASQYLAGSNAKQNVTLRAASYNTFTSAGEQVVLDRQLPTGERGLPRGLQSQADFKQVAKRFRLFADDARERIVHAEADLLHFVPIDEFKLPDEPYLLAQLEGPAVLFCERDNELNLVPMDKRIEITMDDMPAGMTLSDNKLTWRPDSDQVGSVTLVATIKYAEIQRTQRFELEVAYPSSKLPFPPSGFAINATGTRAALWEGPRFDEFGQPQPAAQKGVKVAIVNLETGEVEAQRQVAEPIGRGILTDEHLLLLSAQQGSPRCEILRQSDLQRATTLVASSPIYHVDVSGDVLVIQAEREIDLYNVSTFKRLKSFAVQGNPNSSLVTEHGVLVNGVLYGFDLQPKLILQPGNVFALGGADHVQPESIGLIKTVPLTYHQQQMQMRNLASEGRIATESVPGKNIQVGLDVRRQQLQVPGAIHTMRTEFELSLTASGAVDKRQVIVRKNLPSQMNGQVPQISSVLQLTNRDALVISGSDLYRWELPRPSDDAALVPLAKLNWLLKQSSLTIASSGKTDLKHELLGAKAPVTFAAVSSFDSIQIDPMTGVVTIDNSAILAEALGAVVGLVQQHNRGESHAQTLRTQAESVVAHATKLLGRKPAGFPVAIPIHVTASDADLANSSLQYYVIAEVPAAELMSKMAELDKTRAEQMAQMQAKQESARTRQPDAAGAPKDSGDLAEINRRMEAIEQRMDLITRQLNSLLKKLEEKESP